MTKLMVVLALVTAACGGKKSGGTTPTTGSGSAQVADPKPAGGSDANPEAPEKPEEDPCAVPPPH